MADLPKHSNSYDKAASRDEHNDQSTHVEVEEHIAHDADSVSDGNSELAGVSTYNAKRSDYFTILATGFALISDGYQNNVMTVINAIFVRYSGGGGEWHAP